MDALADEARCGAADPAGERAFLRRTYAHLFGAVVAFAAVEAALLSSGVGVEVLKSIRSAGTAGWVGLVVAFIAGGFAAQGMARSRRSARVQYAGLALYMLIEAVIFLPIFTLTERSLPLQAGIVTLLAFGGLTVGVFRSTGEFAVRGPAVSAAVLLVVGLVVAVWAFGFSVGLAVAAAVVALAAGFILYQTATVMNQYGTRDHVAASVALFASVALMLVAVLHIFAASGDD